MYQVLGYFFGLLPVAGICAMGEPICRDSQLICNMMSISHTNFCNMDEFKEEAQKYCPRTCGYCHQTFEHGTNLIWAQTPYVETFTHVSSLVAVHGDPAVWVPNRTPKVNYISARYHDWEFRALGFHWHDQKLFWSERVNRKIQCLELNSTSETRTLFAGTSSEVNGIAVDWLSNNLYFTDALYNWVMMTSASPDNHAYRIIVQDKLDSPHGLAVYPQKGYLFWSDWGARPKIEMSDLMGNGRRHLVERNVGQPRGLTVDYDKNLLYWVDSVKTTVEVVQFNGQGRKVVQQDEGTSFYGIALYENFIFVTERSRGLLKVYDHMKTAASFTLHNVPADIIMYDSSQQPGNSSDCDDLVCEQLCVYDPVAGARCLCGEGYLGKQTDNASCVPSFKFVHPSHIYAIGDSICQYPANMADMSLVNITLNSQCFLEDRQGYMTLTYEASENMLYYFSNNTKTISRIPLEMGGKGNTVTGGTGVVKGMSLDWSSGNLYWTDSDRGEIKVARKTGAHQALVLGGLNNPVGIAVHPIRGRMFWTDHGHLPDIGAKVESANLDGSEREIIMGENLGEPNHLFIDFQKDSVYWTDSIMFHVRKLDLSTGKITVVLEEINVKFYGISMFKDFILWTDTDDLNGLHVARMDKKTKVRGIIHPNNGVAADLITFDSLQQPKFNSSCSEAVSRCSQLCLLGPGAQPNCVCGSGYDLSDDGFTCITTPVMNEFILLNDAYQQLIFQMNLKNGVVKAIDLQPRHDPIALTYDPFEFRVFWSDNEANVIKQASIDGKYEKTVLLMSNSSMCDGLAADYINKLLFYTDTGKNVIGVISMRNYELNRPIIDTDLDEPRDIVVSPNDGLIYWSDWGSKASIEQANMDGSGRQTVVNNKGITWPNGLALEVKAKKLYFVDAHADKVCVVDLNTKTLTTLLHEPQSHYFSIEVIGDYLYIADWGKNYLRRMKKEGGTLKKFGSATFTRLYGISGFNASEAFKGISVCVSSICDQLCLPKQGNLYTCKCVGGYTEVGPRCVKSVTTEGPIVVPSGSQVTITRPLPQRTTTTVATSPLSSSSLSPTPQATTAQTTSQQITTITKIPAAMTTDVTADGTQGGIDVSITPTTTVTTASINSTGTLNIFNETGTVGRSTIPASTGLSLTVICVIVASCLLVIVLIIGIAILHKKRYIYKIGHGKLIEDKNPADFYKIGYQSAGDDAITIDTGIVNPTYDYMTIADGNVMTSQPPTI